MDLPRCVISGAGLYDVMITIELETPWLANLLGHWAQKFDHSPFSSWFIPRRRSKPPVSVIPIHDSDDSLKAILRMQLAAVPLLDPAHVEMEKMALQKHFKKKRDHVLARLHELHLDVECPPTSTFYIWLNLEKLPPPLNNGLVSLLFIASHQI